MSIQSVVRVGVGCFVTSSLYPRSVLVGIRKGSHGAGKLALPGGHLELGESWETCAAREVEEETNLKLDSDLQFVYCTNSPNIDNNPSKHYITIFMHGKISSTSPPLQNMEPNKCEDWKWIKWTELTEIASNQPHLLFDPMLHFINGKGGQLFHDIINKEVE